MNENRGNIEIDLKRLVMSLVRRIWLIILVGVMLAVLAVGCASIMITPMYSASVKLYVNNTYGANSPGFSSSQLQAAQSLANTYMVFLDSRDVMEDIAKESGLNYSASQIRSMIDASAVNETEVFRVRVICADYKHAAKIANAVAEVLPDRIASYIEGSSVVVVEHAVENPNPVSPVLKNFAFGGFVGGAILVIVFVIMKEMLDTSINSEEYLAVAYNDLPLLAVIPDAENPRASSGYKGYYESQSKKPSSTKTGGKN